MEPSHSIGQKILLAFAGKQLTSEMRSALQAYRPAGVTLFRSLNIDHPAQVRQLTNSLQQLARSLDLPPLLIAADQEGGQLMAVGQGVTPLPGNMALGAVRSVELARRAGEVLGRELAAMGINVNYAPSCDVNLNPRNPVIGVRSFGEDPEQVGDLAGAMIKGIQPAGVAATAKHFPGHGDTSGDSHHGLPSVPHSLERLEALELPPFQAAIQAGVRLVMTAHLALPALDGPDAQPATLSPSVLRGLLRERLGFNGVVVTDAMDMQAIRQGKTLGEDAVRAAAAGADLLLLTANPEDQRRVYQSLLDALQDGRLDAEDAAESIERVLSLKRWLSGQTQPKLSVIGCEEHLALAAEIADRSITLVRDDAGLLPLQLDQGKRLAVVVPRPVDLTPADTSSYIQIGLADAVRRYHANVEEFPVSFAPEPAEVASLLDQLRGFDALILATLNAYSSPGQAEFARAALTLGIPTAVAALRLPYDLAEIPQAKTYLCSYSIQMPSMQALAKALFGRIECQGRLPVSIPGLYSAGHGQSPSLPTLA